MQRSGPAKPSFRVRVSSGLDKLAHDFEAISSSGEVQQGVASIDPVQNLILIKLCFSYPERGKASICSQQPTDLCAIILHYGLHHQSHWGLLSIHLEKFSCAFIGRPVNKKRP